ncbi:hypothetical protein [Castellaniella denitrificans]|uniref:hypothetical protein n=1 Tax=Castellaniella denitrificans TaxID=56119 RepID=UPI0036145EA0
MKTYRALKAFPHGNSHVAAGAIVNLTDKQATFLIGFVEPVDSIPTAPALAEAPAADADEDGGKKKGAKK